MTLSHQKIFTFVVYLIIGLLELRAKPLMGDCPILIKIKPLRHISTTEKNGVALEMEVPSGSYMARNCRLKTLLPVLSKGFVMIDYF